MIEAFDPNPPNWTESAKHAFQFCCPKCSASCTEATRVWINRRSPVYTETQRRKWQEFYECQCGCSWWVWSSDRPPSKLTPNDEITPNDELF